MTGEQGSFWEYHDAVYALGFPPNSGQLTDDVLIRLARDLDVERSTATMQSQETLDAVTTDFREGQQLGITGVLGLGDTTDLEFRAQSRIAELSVHHLDVWLLAAAAALLLGVIALFAVGCPACNELVQLALGASGAMTYFEPVQPVLSVLALLLLAWALVRRLRGQIGCAVPGEVEVGRGRAHG